MSTETRDVTKLNDWPHVWFNGTNYAIDHCNESPIDCYSEHVLRAKVNRIDVYAQGGTTWQWSELTVNCATGAVRVCGVQIGEIRNKQVKVFTAQKVAEIIKQ